MKERRRFPRITISLDVTVVNRDGESLSGLVTDLSESGLTVEGNLELMKHIEVIDPLTDEPCFPVEAEITFTSDAINVSNNVKLACRRVNKNRLSQNQFRMGMIILDGCDEDKQSLAEFIRSRL